MRAVTWQGRRKVSVDTVPDPAIKEPSDAIIRVTSTNICGSDLHLYEVLGAFMSPGDILGHEAMGVVEEVGGEVDNLKVGDRVVIPFNISCGHCFMCDQGLQSQCETTQNRDQGTGAALFGYSKLYGEVAGGQAEYLRVPQAQYTHIKVPQDGPDERYVYLSDVLPTAWQARRVRRRPRGRHAGGARPGADRVDGVPDRVPPQLPRPWRRLGRRTTESRAGALRRRHRPPQGRPRRRRPQPYRRPRRRLGHRRGRHGGPRLAGRRGCTDRKRIPAVARRPRRHEARGG